MTNGLEVSSVYIVMTVAQEYMRKSTLEKESGNRLPEFLETLPPCPKTAGEWRAEERPHNEEASRRETPALPVQSCFPVRLHTKPCCTNLRAKRGL
jgi:hypothetical protein